MLKLICLIMQKKKIDLKTAKEINTSNFALKSNLVSLNTEVDKIDAGKLKSGPIELSKLRNVVNNDVVKKAEYDKLVAKVNNIETREFVLKTKYDTDKSELERKIFDTTGLVKKLDYHAKIRELESK